MMRVLLVLFVQEMARNLCGFCSCQQLLQFITLLAYLTSHDHLSQDRRLPLDCIAKECSWFFSFPVFLEIALKLEKLTKKAVNLQK